MSVEKKSRRTVNSSSSSNEQPSQSKETKDAHPTAQKIVYFGIGSEQTDVKNYIEKLIAGQISGETMEVSTMVDGKEVTKEVRKWKHVTPYPIEFVEPALDVKSSMSGEAFIQAFQSPNLRAQLIRRPHGANLFHGWLFNFDGYFLTKWPEKQIDLVVAFGLKVIRQEEATWACMHGIYRLPFGIIQDVITSIQHNDGLLPLEPMDEMSHPLMSELNRLITSEEKVDWVELYERWLEDVITVVNATTSPPTPEQQSKMASTLERVLGSDNARLVKADMQRCLRPLGKRQNLIPADFRFIFDFAYRDNGTDRMFLAQCLLLRLVEASENWKQRLWVISNSLVSNGNESLRRMNPWADIWGTAFGRTYQETSLPADDPVAMWQMAGPGVKKVIAGIVEHSPQLKKDRLVGNILTKKFAREDGKPHPIRDLVGWKRLMPTTPDDIDKNTGKPRAALTGTAQVVFSFLGKAQDTTRRNAVSRFASVDDDDDSDTRVIRRDYNTAPVGAYAPFVRATAATKKLSLLSSS